MRFVDGALITVKAGDGGKGIVSFRREKNVARGGPDGGDGGKGGDVFLLGDDKLHSLLDYKYTDAYAAPSGKSGGKTNRRGADGKELVLPVPIGTLVYDADSDERIGEILTDGERLAVAYGGKGGYGNRHFKSSVRRAPIKATSGFPGEKRKLKLELRILSDVGLVGLPNAGKSSFLAAATAAKPKVANYPFTTLDPACGVFAETVPGAERGLILADLPGIIKGAAAGKGLGLEFLRHIRRARLLFHLTDLSGEDPAEDVRIFERELGAFDKNLLRIPRWILGSKADLPDAKHLSLRINQLKQFGLPVYSVSSLRGEGVDAVCRKARTFLAADTARNTGDSSLLAVPIAKFVPD